MKYKNKRLLVLGISILLFLLLYIFKNLSTVIIVSGFIFGLLIFYIFDHMFEMDFKLKHYCYVMFILSGGILLYPLYFYPTFDKLLHFIMPIFGCFLIFYVINKKNLTLQWKLLITFMFILSFLAIHEIGEYILDILWDAKLQGVYIGDDSQIRKLNLVMSQIDDTMIDLIIGTTGALVFTAGKTAEWFFKRNK